MIEIDRLSKLYRLGSIGYGTLRQSAAAWWDRVRGRRQSVPLPSGLHPSQMGPRPDTFWALKDVSFNVGEGDIVGIIGRNGAGKSTLLKLISRITQPTSGRAVLNGRVGSLLEVGAGFHAELSGMDNIFLHGAILGMTKADTSRKLDEIVAFADIDGFLDTPVKHYSSGMYVRLAFAVAAHLEPDILVVDEVLSVGDAAFQEKCLGRVKDISSTHGRTVLFVSHNIESIQQLCGRCLLLERGHVRRIGDTRTVVSEYLSDGATEAEANRWIDVSGAARDGTGEAQFGAVKFTSSEAAVSDRPYTNGPLEISLAIDASTTTRVQSIAIGLRDESGRKLVNADLGIFGQTITLNEGRTTVRLRIDQLHLKPGTYGLALWMARYTGEYIGDGDVLDFIERAASVEVVELSPRGFRTALGDTGVVPCTFRLLDVSHPHTLRGAAGSASFQS